MEKNTDERLEKIEEAIRELPEKAQQAIYWAISHWNLVEQMCRKPGITNEEVEKYKADARAKEDYIMLALLCAAQAYNNSNYEDFG